MKKFALLALLILAVALFAACTQEETHNQTYERRTLVMGTSAGFPPFEFIADHGQGVIGQYAGIDISLVYRIAQELDVDIIVQDQEFAGLILALQTREVDFIAAGMTIRPDRAEMVNFSVPYFTAGQRVVVRADSPANSVADLEGMIVGVQIGTTGDIAITDGHDDGVVTFDDILRYNQPVPGILDLLSGSIDAFVIDAPVARGFLANHPDDLRIFYDPNEFFGPEQFGMAFHLDDTALLAEFNAVLERLIAEGYVDYLYEYYTTKLAQD
jgi:polar amino acid transport system substrate-binding protein